jgi:hypothetical protein
MFRGFIQKGQGSNTKTKDRVDGITDKITLARRFA